MDGRDEPGHDEKANRFQVVSESLKMLAAFSVRLLGKWHILGECYADPLFLSPYDLAGTRGAIGVNHQRKAFRDTDRAGDLQARAGLRQYYGVH